MANLVILYGGETGNCEDLAKRLSWEAKRRKLGVQTRPLDNYPLSEMIADSFYLFVVSTTGQGDVPANMQLFWRRLLRKSLPGDALKDLTAAVIGLGDSSYLKYNFVGKKLFKRLKQLGANLILDLALGDDQHDHGFDAGVDPFLTQFWPTVCGYFKKPASSELSDQTLPPPTFELHHIMCGKSVPWDQIPNPPPYTEETPLRTTIISNQRVTAIDHFQDVRLIKIALNEHVTYAPGDVVLLRPENSDEDVDKFVEIFDLDQDKYKYGNLISAKPREDNVTSNSYSQMGAAPIRTIVKEWLGIHSVPKRSFFELLWRFSPDDLEREKLQEFSTTEGQEELINYCVRPKRNILEVLADFPKTAPCVPLEYLFDLIPAIKPRAFSIASSPTAHPRELHILMAVVSYKTRMKELRTGLCSHFLARKNPGDRIDIWLKKGTFKVPTDVPLLMVGPGTGVAPFRSMIHERIASQMSAGNVLFFGCRLQNADFYFEEEWTALSEKVNVVAAFSRSEPDKKIYVQHKIWEERRTVGELICSSGAHVLIAGNSNQMPQNVREMLVKVIEEMQSGIDGEQMISKLENSGRIQYECWS